MPPQCLAEFEQRVMASEVPTHETRHTEQVGPGVAYIAGKGIVTVTTVGGHGGSGRDCRNEVAT